MQLPQPRNGWRAFLGDVGVIVIGVLVALGIGEIADALRWQILARDSIGAVNIELAQDAGVFQERMRMQPCLDRRIAEVDAILRKARRSGKLPDIGEIGRAPTRPISVDAWKQLAGSETLLHIDGQKRMMLSGGYPNIDEYRQELIAENQAWATLLVLEHAPGPVSESLLAEVEVTLARLRYKNWSNGINAKQVFGMIAIMGIAPSYYAIFDREVGRDEFLASLHDRTVCKPLTVDGEAMPSPT